MLNCLKLQKQFVSFLSAVHFIKIKIYYSNKYQIKNLEMGHYSTKNEYSIVGTRKTIKLNSIFNTTDVLEFHVGIDKRCLYLAESTLSFSVILPEHFIPDNGFVAKCEFFFNKKQKIIN
jgi:hypothetical protein